jgi:hypothetical protein
MEPPSELGVGSLVDLSKSLAAHIYRSLDEEKIEKEFERLRELDLVMRMELLDVEK